MKMMLLEEYLTIRDLTFKTLSYHRNFDLIVSGENIINEYDGKISKLRILEKKPPLQVGEYAISTWDLRTGRELNIDIYNMIKIHANEPIYNETLTLINNNKLSFDNYDKVVFIQSLLIMKDYRKKQITEEFIEFIHKEFYNEKTLIIAFVLPIQYNETFMNFFMDVGFVEKSEELDGSKIEKISTNKYYQIEELISQNLDKELNEIKLFSVAQKCGFERIDESFMFKYNPKKIIDRLRVKWNLAEKV